MNFRQKTFILVPHWIAKALERNLLRLSDIGNYSRLKEIFSVEDIASILALQEAVCEKCKDKISPFVGWLTDPSFWNLKDLWGNTALEREALSRDRDILYDIGYSKMQQEEVLLRLTKNDNDIVNSKDLYTLVDCDKDLIVMVVYPGFIEALERPKFMYGIFKRLLKILYVYLGPVECFSMRVYKEYIKLLGYLNAGELVDSQKPIPS